MTNNRVGNRIAPSQVTAAAFLLIISLAETLTVFADARYGFWIHLIIFTAMVFLGMMDRSRPQSRLWLTLALGEHTLSYILHNINLIWLGFFSIMAWNQATKGNRLVDKDMPSEVARSVRRAALLEPIVMVIGIIGALIGQLWWMLSFLLLFIIPIVGKAFKKKR